MFKIVDRPEFTHDVPVMVPVDGGYREEKLRTRYRVVPDSEAESLVMSRTEDVKAFLRLAVVGFEDVVDDADQPIPYSDELRERLIGAPHVRLALVRGYTAAVSKARLGN
ncbi:hypothetical protein T8T21_00690 [Limimaricola variabilis]|uniref:hypothetical protein n=1 Tax=Limimaricola variabilis TaxID=1492771 RepID=UPI002AC93335|nr:hypothetical protein [Limimaricola variabilis]WPY94675.1 hypothetical protein T8T21_00690 [Limimaricola variabilis]